MFKITPLETSKAFLGKKDYAHLLDAEIKAQNPKNLQVYGELFLAEGDFKTDRIFWQQNTWLSPVLIEFDSIKDCAKALCSMQRSWHPYLWAYFRRGELIQQQMPYVSSKPIVFGSQIPKSALGSWTLLNEHLCLASPSCSSTRPNGLWTFVESKDPPSRAYLKIWEILSRMPVSPTSEDVCIELGASPGGWTFVLEKLVKKVIAFDRAPLRQDLMASKKVDFYKKDAFSINFEQFKEASWLFSDIICYPDKLYDFLTKKVLPSPTIKHVVFTIKFQGSEDKSIISHFASIENAQIIYLSANKHELTFILHR